MGVLLMLERGLHEAAGFIGFSEAGGGLAVDRGAQQPAMPVIGFINGQSPDDYAPLVAAFRRGLRQAAWSRDKTPYPLSLGQQSEHPSAGAR